MPSQTLKLDENSQQLGDCLQDSLRFWHGTKFAAIGVDWGWKCKAPGGTPIAISRDPIVNLGRKQPAYARLTCPIPQGHMKSRIWCAIPICPSDIHFIFHNSFQFLWVDYSGTSLYKLGSMFGIDWNSVWSDNVIDSKSLFVTDGDTDIFIIDVLTDISNVFKIV